MAHSLILITLLLVSAPTARADDKPRHENWVPLFNGKNLEGWTPKIKGYPRGENFADTFRVEDGVLKVVYDKDKYGSRFRGRFGHLFYRRKFSHYRLRVEYRFVGEQAPGGPDWAYRNSGVMIHGESPETMEKNQDFPASIEVQLLGGNGKDERPTANVCTPGTNIVMNGELITRHCTNSSSKTYSGDQWVAVEIEVDGDRLIRHIIDGKTVLEYNQPQLDERDEHANKLIEKQGKMLSAGTISLQSESHPVEFRKIEILNLAEPQLETHTYKQAGNVAIKADVYRYQDAAPRPVVVWIHGGALIMGHRESVDQRLKELCTDNGWIVVSIDYRLAPETQLPEIIRDVEDAFRWIGEKGPGLFHADPKRIAVAGGSAGGYLTLTSGFRAERRPVALVSFWGYGDLVGPWYSEPSPHPRHHQSKLSREEAFKQVSGPPISDARDRKGDGGGFYQFCRQQGMWPKAVSGWDPKTEPEKFFPFMPVKNVTAEYPPTLLIHGEKDTDVPYEQSVMMAAELKKHGVEHRLISVPEGEHGLPGVDRGVIDGIYRDVAAFLQKHLEPKGP
jgi:acetyl esterase/lipase